MLLLLSSMTTMVFAKKSEEGKELNENYTVKKDEACEKKFKEHIEKMSDKALELLGCLFKTCIERNELKDPHDLELRLEYQKKRGGKTFHGKDFKKLTISEFLDVIGEETIKMRKYLEDIKEEQGKRKNIGSCHK